MGLLVVVFPIARSVWLAVSAPDVAVVLSSTAAARVAGITAAAMWSAAILIGGRRGPALLAPLLVHVLAESDMRRTRVFGRPLAVAGASSFAVATIAAGFVAGSLSTNGQTDALGAVLLIVMGSAVGIIAFGSAVLGQALGRAAAPTSAAVALLGVLGATSSTLRPFLPSGWVDAAMTAATSEDAAAAMPVLLLLVLALLAVLAVPVSAERLRVADLIAHATRWEVAVNLGSSMEFGAASTLYQTLPTIGRRISAVRWSGSTAARFFIRTVVGAARTPGRFVFGVVQLGVSSAMLVIASTSHEGVLIGAVAGAVMFSGLGPLTDGIRHASQVVAAGSIYGVADGHLVALHCLLPVSVTGLTVGGAIIARGALDAPDLPLFGLCAAAIGASMVGLRLAGALKGPLPLMLMTSAPSPLGDPMPVVRLLWGLDGPVLAVLLGASAGLPGSPLLPVLSLGALVAGVVTARWRRRFS
ncbi:hypothetical protein JOE38_002350 [Clavibacter michiganensis]|uniref:hypothetical protein n=1 Tax=Clavibacter michiganensis TaxID=28447 RepID=UPI00195EFC82|nr:hypothetical protein [Clavibacter michiganensis]MBM7412527.1 hypothetical protein [Clavibacter michiganensis]